MLQATVVEYGNPFTWLHHHLKLTQIDKNITVKRYHQTVKISEHRRQLSNHTEVQQAVFNHCLCAMLKLVSQVDLTDYFRWFNPNEICRCDSGLCCKEKKLNHLCCWLWRLCNTWVTISQRVHWFVMIMSIKSTSRKPTVSCHVMLSYSLTASGDWQNCSGIVFVFGLYCLTFREI